MAKPRLNTPQLFNMSFGFLGIQFGWGLQQANISAIYEKLGTVEVDDQARRVLLERRHRRPRG